MKVIATLVLALLAAVTVSGKSIVWEKAYGGSRIDNNPKIHKLSDGYVMIASTQSFDGDVSPHYGFSDLWMVKTDTTGNIIWRQTIGGSDIEVVTAFSTTSDGGYIICGESFSSHINGVPQSVRGLGDAWLVKTDSLGNLQWTKTYGGWQPDYFYDVKQTSDGGFIAAGYTKSPGGDVSHLIGNSDVWIVKTDSLGNIVWEKTYGGSSYETARSILPLANGTFLVAGSTASTDGNVNGNHGGKDAWVLSISATGGLVWARTLGGSDDDDLFKIYAETYNSFILIGETRSSDGDISINHGKYDAWMYKIDGNGVGYWSRTFGGSENDGVYDIKPGFKGQGYALAGFTASFDGDVSHKADTFSNDAWVFTTNNSGFLNWEQTYGGSNSDYAFGVIPTSNTDFIFTASTASTDGDVGATHGDVDCWMVKVHSLKTPTGVEEQSTPRVLVRPTVVHAGFNVIIPGEYGMAALSLLDMTGRVLLEHQHQESGFVSTSHLSPGMYLVRIQNNSSQEVFRIIVQ